MSTGITKEVDNLTKISDAFASAFADFKPSYRIDLGEPLPLYRVTGTDHRVNSADVPRG